MKKSIQAVTVAVALLFALAFPASADSFTKTAIVQMLVTETHDAKIKQSDIARIVNIAFAEAKKQKVDPLLVISLIKTESRFRWWATNKSGARGLTQVIPRWHRDKINGRNIMNIQTNIEVGTTVLADCLDRNKGLIKKALRCYSGGAVNYASKLKTTYTQLKLADVRYRFDNELPLVVFAKFEEPSNFSVSYQPMKVLAEREPELFASNTLD